MHHKSVIFLISWNRKTSFLHTKTDVFGKKVHKCIKPHNMSLKHQRQWKTYLIKYLLHRGWLREIQECIHFLISLEKLYSFFGVHPLTGSQPCELSLWVSFCVWRWKNCFRDGKTKAFVHISVRLDVFEDVFRARNERLNGILHDLLHECQEETPTCSLPSVTTTLHTCTLTGIYCFMHRLSPTS